MGFGSAKLVVLLFVIKVESARFCKAPLVRPPQGENGILQQLSILQAPCGLALHPELLTFAQVNVVKAKLRKAA